MAGGPTVNLVIAIVLFAVVFMAFGAGAAARPCRRCPTAPSPTPRPAAPARPPTPSTPASKAGLAAGDEITAFNGAPITTGTSCRRPSAPTATREATIGFERDGTDTHGHRQHLGAGARRPWTTPTERSRTSASSASRRHRGTSAQGPATSSSRMGDMTGRTATAIGTCPRAWSTSPRPPSAPSATPGHADQRRRREPRRRRVVSVDDPTWSERAQRVARPAGEPQPVPRLFNLIPLLPLDGGHIAGALWEGLRSAIARLRGTARSGLRRRREDAARRLRRGCRPYGDGCDPDLRRHRQPGTPVLTAAHLITTPVPRRPGPAWTSTSECPPPRRRCSRRAAQPQDQGRHGRRRR